MLKYYVKTSEALKRLRTDKDGVVSFEYVIVAFCIVGAVSLAFGTGTTSGIGAALSGGIATLTTATVMRTLEDRIALAREAVAFAGRLMALP